MGKPSQTFKSSGIVPKHILALSWNIATRPSLYRELALNPYTPHALLIISEKFPEANTVDVVTAVALAEPEGRYDRNLRQLPEEQQEEELHKQINISTEINKRLVQYFKKHVKELSRLSRELVYENLFKVVFVSTDVKEIEQKYSQDQRREFRLAIVDFTEDTQKATSHYQQKNRASGWQLLIIAFLVLSLIPLFIITTQKQTLSNAQRSEDKTQILGINNQKKDQSLPVRLRIPNINVDAAIEYLGVTSTGEMEVPKNTINVGWFDIGPRPGQVGSSVIAGHFDGAYGQAAVFANLDKLRPGDKLYVEDSNGKSTAFVVQGSRVYDPGYADDVFSRNDGQYLNLVTCDGVWVGSKKSFSKRLVVFTDITH